MAYCTFKLDKTNNLTHVTWPSKMSWKSIVTCDWFQIIFILRTLCQQNLKPVTCEADACPPLFWYQICGNLMKNISFDYENKDRYVLRHCKNQQFNCTQLSVIAKMNSVQFNSLHLQCFKMYLSWFVWLIRFLSFFIQFFTNSVFN